MGCPYGSFSISAKASTLVSCLPRRGTAGFTPKTPATRKAHSTVQHASSQFALAASSALVRAAVASNARALAVRAVAVRAERGI